MQADPQKSLLLDRQDPSSAPGPAARQLGAQDIEVIRRAAAGDPDAVGLLVDRWASDLYHCTDSLRIPACDADEIVEEVLRRLIFDGNRMASMPHALGPWMRDTFKACAGAVVSRPKVAFRSDKAQSTAARNFSAMLESRGINDALRHLNSMTPFRFTAVYKVDGLSISNLLMFDRESGFSDDPSPSRISDTFCIWVHETMSVVQLEDSLTDPRAIGHPKRNVIRSYCGGPVRNPDGVLIGTLCHFAYEPHLDTMPAVEVLAEICPMLAPMVGSQSTMRQPAQ